MLARNFGVGFLRGLNSGREGANSSYWGDEARAVSRVVVGSGNGDCGRGSESVPWPLASGCCI